MTVPHEIQKYLESDQRSEVALACLHQLIDIRRPEVARITVLVNREEGEYCVAITPGDTVLDLNQVERVLGKSHKPLLGDALDAYLSSKKLLGLSGLSNFEQVPTLIDQQLLGAEVVFLAIGIDNQYIQLNQQDFALLFGKTSVGNIAVPLADLEVPVKSHLDQKEIFDSVSQFTELRIKQRLEETLELPPLPTTAQRIIKLRVDPNADIGDLASIVEVDPSLAAQVVSWAASPYYSAPGTIKSIHDAIVRVLGFDMVLNLALGLSLGKAMEAPKSGPSGVLSYWEQAVHVAASVEALVTLMPRESRPSFGTAYLAGLLNNFGYLVLMEVFPPHFSSIARHIEANPHVNPGSIDRHILGISRDQLACWLMEYWNMPESVCIALRHQNNPDYDGADWEYPLLIYLSNNLLRHQGVLTGAPLQPIPDSVYARLKIDPEQAKETIRDIVESNEELLQIADCLGR